jgi:hypothetical protein
LGSEARAQQRVIALPCGCAAVQHYSRVLGVRMVYVACSEGHHVAFRGIRASARRAAAGEHIAVFAGWEADGGRIAASG